MTTAATAQLTGGTSPDAGAEPESSAEPHAGAESDAGAPSEAEAEAPREIPVAEIPETEQPAESIEDEIALAAQTGRLALRRGEAAFIAGSDGPLLVEGAGRVVIAHI